MVQPEAPLNPDDKLSDVDIILKYQLQFTRHFGPDYAYGVYGVGHNWESNKNGGREYLQIRARVKPIYQPTKGKQTHFEVPMEKFKVGKKVETG